MSTHREEADLVESQECQGSMPRTWVNNLAPPPETSYYSRQTVTFFNDQPIGFATKYGKFTWTADVYIYATGARPDDPDFSQKGLLNIIFLHSGYVEVYDDFSADLWSGLDFSLMVKDSKLQPSLQFPETETGIKEDDNYKYEINYAERMPMFKNNGNETFNFDANFQHTFTRICSKQSGSRASDIKFGINNTKNSNEHRTTEIYGFSKFTHKDPSAFPLTITRDFVFWARDQPSWQIWGNVSLKLGF
ncbi:hypothetical protein ONZ45_g3614 [Pleurotus djamor]|nr:hypothetical protein ONZ45_g3614 [Pleurotus djamor]